jgi:D-alanine-D-alanine ligase
MPINKKAETETTSTDTTIKSSVTPAKKADTANKISVAAKKNPNRIKLSVDYEALKKFRLVVVAYSSVQREHFATKDAYLAEVEVEQRAIEVSEEVRKLGIPVRTLPGDQYFYTNLLVDKPDLVINLVDTLKGRDQLQPSVPAALELANIHYTGAGIEGLIIGNNRNLTKRLLMAYDVPTPPFQFIRRAGTNIDEGLGLPLICKLNEGGGSVGINNNAVKESIRAAKLRVNQLISTYHFPVIVEKFIDGPEVTVVVVDDGVKRHVAMAQKKFGIKPDGKHEFTSIESYNEWKAYKYVPVDENTKYAITKLAVRAFGGLQHKDYAKFDIRIDKDTGIPYFTDSNPNTAFGPDKGLPMTEVLGMNGVEFSDVLASLLSKYAKNLR